MKKTTQKAKKTKTESNFSITITMGDKVYKGEGETGLEALTSMNKPEKIMGKGIVLVESNGLKKEVLMFPVRLRRLFYNKLFQQIQVKWLVSGLK